MRVVVITAQERGLASKFLVRRRELPGVELVGVLLDEGAVAARRAHVAARWRKLRRVGPTGVPVGAALRRMYAQAVADAPRVDEAAAVVRRVPTANGEQARVALGDLAPDLALSLGARVLREETFTLPRLGTINLHHGAVPRFRGSPPAFWEIVEGEHEVGYTVHRIDAGIDTGAVLAEGAVRITYRPTLAATLAETLPALYESSLDALDEVLLAVSEGRVAERPQEDRGAGFRTTPALRDLLRARREVRRRPSL